MLYRPKKGRGKVGRERKGRGRGRAWPAIKAMRRDRYRPRKKRKRGDYGGTSLCTECEP